MSQPSYDYTTRTGILPISWNDMHGLCRALALTVSAYAPEIILPVWRGGFYPGTLLAYMLQVDVHPIHLSRRVNDMIVYALAKNAHITSTNTGKSIDKT